MDAAPLVRRSGLNGIPSSIREVGLEDGKSPLPQQASYQAVARTQVAAVEAMGENDGQSGTRQLIGELMRQVRPVLGG